MQYLDIQGILILLKIGIIEMLARNRLLSTIQTAFDSHRIVCLLGPRQCGKTTLAREIR